MLAERHHQTGPQRLLALVALAVAAALTAFCSSGDGGSDNIDGATLSDLREQMIAALFPEDGVMHTHEVFEPDEGGATVTPDREIWRSVATGEARIEAGVGAPVVFADGFRHTLDAGSILQSLPYDRLQDNGALLGSAGILLNESADRTSLKRVSVDGVDAIRIKVFLPTGDGSGTAEVFLSEADRLPIRIEYPNFTVRYEHEVIAIDTLAPDFFSPDALEAAPD